MMRCVLCLLLFCSIASAAPFEWVQYDSTRWARLDIGRPAGTRQVGIYDAKVGLYTPLVNDEWGAPEDPPENMELPVGCKRMPTGVIWSKVPKNEHVYLRGKEISKSDALLMIGDTSGKVPDDRKMPRITVIGSHEKCASPLSVAKKYSQFVSEEYRPEFWAIKDQGFKTDVDPTIYIQDFEGGTYRRLDGYKGDTVFEQVIKDVAQEITGRKIGPRPDNDPSKDRGWKHFLPDLSSNIPWVAIGVIIILIAIAFYHRKEKV